MKTSLLILCLLSACSAQAATRVDGLFTNRHQFVQASPNNARDCRKAGGEWDGNDGPGCFFWTTDKVRVTPVRGKADNYKVDITFTESNGFGCSFDGLVTRTSDTRLEYSQSGKDFDGKDATCTMTITYANSNTLKVESDPACHSMDTKVACGANATLDMDATRKR